MVDYICSLSQHVLAGVWRRKKRTRVAPKARGKHEKCTTKWCRNKRAKKVTRYRSPSGKIILYESRLPYCWKCKTRRLKERHPATYILNVMRGRARQRKIPWTITLAEFKEFCQRTGYVEKRGCEDESLTVDRIDHDKGYHIWNIQVLSFIENCTQGHTVPGRETKQNESGPDVYDYDYDGPVTACATGEPF